MPVRPARPLTAKEKRQLDNWDRTLAGSLTRVLVVAGVLGFLAGAGMTGWLSSETLASGGTVGALSSEFLFLSGAERLVGAGALQVLVFGGAFAAGMMGVGWRMQRAMRRMQAQYRARYLAAGAEGEPPRHLTLRYGSRRVWPASASVAGRRRTAWPPPAARRTGRTVAASTSPVSTVTASGFDCQSASSASRYTSAT